MPATFATEYDGQHTIRLGKQGDGWVARAFRGSRPATDIMRGADRESVLGSVQAALRELRASRIAARAGDGAPSTAEYRDAFAQIAPIHPNHLAMLKAHLHAPDHLITATRLAEAAGYPNWNAANLQYGLLAQRVAEQVDFAPPTRDDGTPIWTATLATWAAESDLTQEQLLASLQRQFVNPHFEWLMRPQVRDAVRDL